MKKYNKQKNLVLNAATVSLRLNSTPKATTISQLHTQARFTTFLRILVQDWNSGDKFQYLPSSSRFDLFFPEFFLASLKQLTNEFGVFKTTLMVAAHIGFVMRRNDLDRKAIVTRPIIPYHIGRRELDIVIWNEHISFTTSKVGSLVDVRVAKIHMGFVFSIISFRLIPMEIRSLVVRFEPLRSDGSLHLMYAELQYLSPFLPTHEAHFLYYHRPRNSAKNLDLKLVKLSYGSKIDKLG
ncbi:hypothetical protein IFM89_003068 [Coptis chinensis]|uniref:Uncharacterized protein n=1 Tax=Coptis chinensis TaxID=261450 RepID=A0A835M6L9_9MAGN|nr:hypothetical protein IFM89_003068 [Coptis chinensis]